jgi:meso-butanediol dehydrogenase / (S,S)-butanediol dehydrogenase / diacetyl reductase
MWGMDGKVVIITGAGNGIGRATAEIFASQKATVIVVDILEDAAQDTVTHIQARGGKASLALCDVSRADSVRRMVEDVVAQFGHIDVLHANAAVQVNKEALEISEQEWDRMHAVNLKGVFLTCAEALRVMRRQKHGAIIVSSSGHAFATCPNLSSYAATKGGELAFARGLALENAPYGIRVNCVIPGATDTRLVRAYVEESSDPAGTRRSLIKSIPMGRLAKPEEIGTAVLFLASDYASYITGTSLVVDGGLLAWA